MKNKDDHALISSQNFSNLCPEDHEFWEDKNFFKPHEERIKEFPRFQLFPITKQNFVLKIPDTETDRNKLPRNSCQRSKEISKKETHKT